MSEAHENDNVLIFQTRMKLLNEHFRERAGQSGKRPDTAGGNVDDVAASILIDATSDQRKFEKLAKVAAVLGKAAKESNVEIQARDGIVNLPKTPERTPALVNALKKELDHDLADYCGTLNFPPYSDGDAANLHDQIIAFGNKLREELFIEPDRDRALFSTAGYQARRFS